MRTIDPTDIYTPAGRRIGRSERNWILFLAGFVLGAIIL